jgi:predicted transcriptional regulator
VTNEATHSVAMGMAELAVRSAVTSQPGVHDLDHLKGIAKTAYDAVVYAHSLSMEPVPDKPKLMHDVGEAVSADGKTVKCLVCGMEGNMLKRHLRAAHGLDPNDYFKLVGQRVPLTAPAYAAKRSEVAKASGLGKGPKRKKAA